MGGVHLRLYKSKYNLLRENELETYLFRALLGALGSHFRVRHVGENVVGWCLVKA